MLEISSLGNSDQSCFQNCKASFKNDNVVNRLQESSINLQDLKDLTIQQSLTRKNKFD